MMIVDTHTHYGLCFEERDGPDPTLWLEALDEEGVDGALLLALRGLLPHENVSAANDRLVEIASHAPERILPFGTVNPVDGPASVAEAERCVKTLGMKGLKWHPWLQGFWALGGDEVHAVCEVCGEAGAAIVFHDGTPNVSMPSQVAELARAHPRTTFILGHAGLLHLWRQAAEAAALYENVYVALCGPHPGGLRHICATVPTERILWGSDYGFSFDSLLGYRKGLVGRLGLGAAEYDAIMGGNAARLFDMRPSAE